VWCHKNSWIYLTSTYYWWFLRPTITIQLDSKFQIIAQLFDSIRFEMKKNTICTALTARVSALTLVSFLIHNLRPQELSFCNIRIVNHNHQTTLSRLNYFIIRWYYLILSITLRFNFDMPSELWVKRALPTSWMKNCLYRDNMFVNRCNQ